VRLALAVGRHDDAYLDYYFGPPDWKRDAARGAPRPLAELIEDARDLGLQARRAAPSLRRAFLLGQLTAVEGYLHRRAGGSLPLAEEVSLVYDADVALARIPLSGITRTRGVLETVAPGPGSLPARLAAFRRRFTVPPERMAAVINATVPILRERVARRLPLPRGERFRWEPVRNRPWEAYSYYQGQFTSIIQINLTSPRMMSRILEILCHEIYPGHHTFIALVEERLVRRRGWREFTVGPFYSPFSLVNEGMAKCAVDMILTPGEQVALCREVIAPAAGLARLDFARLAAYLKAYRCADELATEGARRYLDGSLSAAEAEEFVAHYSADPARSSASIGFARRFGAYALTYVMGQRLIERTVGRGGDRVPRYFRLFGRPLTPGSLLRRPSAATSTSPRKRRARRGLSSRGR